MKMYSIYNQLPFKKLHVLIFRSFFGPFVAGFSIVLFILVLQFLARYIEDIVGKGLDPLVLGKIFLYASGTLVPLALPLAILLSSLMTLGNMGERYELAAIKSAGVSLWNIVKPMAYFVIIVMTFSFYFSFFVVPKANMKLFSLLFDVSKVKPTFALTAGHFYDGIDGYVIHVRDIDRPTDMLYDVKIYDHSEKKRRGNFKVLLADSAKMYTAGSGNYITMELFDGVNHEEFPPDKGSPNTHQYSRWYFDTLNFHFMLTGFKLEESNTLKMSPHQYMKNIFELQTAVDSMAGKKAIARRKMADYMQPIVRVDSSIMMETPDISHLEQGVAELYELFPEHKQLDIVSKAINNARTVKNYAVFSRDKIDDEHRRMNKYGIEFHYRWVLPVTCLVFLLIGAPLGAIVRKGGLGIPAIVSITFFIIFYVLMMQGKKFAKDDILPVWVGTWLPVLVMAPMGLWLTWKSATDSALFDLGALFARLRKLFLFVGGLLGLGARKATDEEEAEQ